ncbi:MAG: hypothetical protein CVU91_00030 [Firmicutes bacterium HGW-Firmicutes-16]|nr:MAG: hypothetical protein CVU91_00030 [Firmicutes bacterium HGW-Firmicutes-16]
MAYCRQCGTQVPDGAAFCPSCGAKDEVRSGFEQAHYNPQAHQPSDAEDNKLISILCYFGPLFLIPYLTKQDSAFVKFHSNQGLVLFILSLLSGFVSNIPYIGWIIGAVCGVFVFVCFVMGIVNVLNCEMKELPLIGKIEILK